MTDRLEQLLSRLAATPADRRLDQLEPAVWARIDGTRRQTPHGAVWGWRAALVATIAALLALAATLGTPARRHPAPDAPRAAASGLRTLLHWARPLRRRPGLMRLVIAASAFGATQICLNSFLVT